MHQIENLTLNRPARPAHPGEVIADILDDLQINTADFAQILGVSTGMVNDIIEGRIPVTADMAIRLGKAFGNGPRLWLNLQQKVDIWDAFQANRENYEQVISLV
ncbi:MAG: HigA family addiction module antitoxin [Oscillatoriaceae cyanobacterium]